MSVTISFFVTDFLTVNYTVALSQLLLEIKHNKVSSAEPQRTPFRHGGFVLVVILRNRLWGITTTSANRLKKLFSLSLALQLQLILRKKCAGFKNDFKAKLKKLIYGVLNLLTNSSHAPTKASLPSASKLKKENL